MNKKQLLAMQKRNKARLTELRGRLEKNEVRAEDLESVQTEVQELADEAQAIADALANIEGGDGEGEDTGSAEGSEEGRSGDESGEGEEGGESGSEDDDEERGQGSGEGEKRSGITPEQREGIMKNIGAGLSSKGHKSAKNKAKEIRSAFGRFVAGQINEIEARALGIETGNGSVTVPKEIAKEIIAYAQEENPLRKYGTRHKTTSTQGFPVLIKKADAQGHKAERTTANPMPETSIELDEITLDPTEFDALATVTKKLLKRSDIRVEDIVIEELKKAYVRKEAQYFFRGDEVDNINDGALSKKAVEFLIADGQRPDLASGQQVYDALVKFKNNVKSSVRKRSMFMINDAALTLIETMKTDDGFPLFKPFEQAANGFDGKILGFNTVVTEFADKSDLDLDTPVMYFGDFKSFHYQDVIGSMEVNRLVELYAASNLVGLQIYNIVDGQLIYSPLEPTMYKYEVVGNTTP
jgi:HK97 family phage major capsid protein